MDNIKIRDVKAGIIADNDKTAEEIRKRLTEESTLFINLMGSPGSGKTSVLKRTIRMLKDDCSIGVIEADVDSDVDARTVTAAGAKAVQLHTGGACHMDAAMTETGLSEAGTKDKDIIFLENVGNLVCPAEFDVGAHIRAMILSVPEGDDKPLKYPLMFKVSDVLLINKIDTLPAFDFDAEKLKERVLSLNPGIKIFELSAKTGAGFDPWIDHLHKSFLKIKS